MPMPKPGLTHWGICYEVSFEQVRPLIGMGGDQVIPKLVPGLMKDDGKAV